MGKIRERIIAYILAFCTLVSAICTGITMPVSAEETTDGTTWSFRMEIQDKDGNWVSLNDGTTVYDDAPLKIYFSWSLSNLDERTGLDIDISKLKNITIQDMPEQELTRNNTRIGTYKIENGHLIISFDPDSEYMKGSDRTGGVTFEGNVSIDDGAVSEDNKVEVGIEGEHIIEATYEPPETQGSSVWIRKDLVEGVTEGKDGYYQTFKVSITANNGDVTINELLDQPESGLSEMSNLTIAEPYPASLSEYLGGGPFTLEQLNKNLAGKTLASGETLTFMYTMKVSEDIYKQGADGNNYKNKFTAHYTDSNEEEHTASTETWVSVNKPSVTKTGELREIDGKKKVVWTVTVYLNDWNGKTIQKVLDTPGNGLIPPESKLSADDFTETPKGSGIYVATYTTDISEDYINSSSDIQLTNYVKITVNGNDYDTTGKVDLVSEHDWIDKNFVKYTPDGTGGGVLTWEVILHIPSEVTNITGVYLDDMPDVYSYNGKHVMQNTIFVDGIPVIENGNISRTDIIKEYKATAVSNVGPQIVFQDSYIKEHANQDIKVQYTTVVSEGQNVDDGFIYHNIATLHYTDTTINEDVSQRADAEWQSEAANFAFVKIGEPAENGNAINYTLKVYLGKDSGLKIGKDIVVTDLLPVGLELNPNSIWIQHYRYYDEYNEWEFPDAAEQEIKKPSETEGEITFKLPVTANTISNINSDHCKMLCIYIHYTATVKDPVALAKKGSEKYTNSATATYDGKEIGSAETTTELTAKKIVVKEATYTTATAPNIEYKVIVNPDALKLSDNGRLEATDTLGSALNYDLNTLVVEKNTGGDTWETLVAGEDYMYSYNAAENSIKFDLPDRMHLRITYKAIVNLYVDYDETNIKGGINNSERLTPENSYNRFKLSGFLESVGSDSKSYNMQALRSDNWAEATHADITIFKYETLENGQMVALDGAEFELKLVKDNNTTEPIELVDADGVTIVKGEKAGEFVVTKLSLDHIYALIEKKAPDGYQRNEEPYYFVIPGVDKVTLPEGLNGGRYLSGSTIYYENVISLVEETPKGELVITKTVTGAERELAEAALEFTVTGPDGQSKVYTLKDDVVVYKDGVWTLTLKDLEPGKYTIEETKYKIDGKVTKRVSYTVDSNTTTLVEDYESRGGTQSATVTVTENGSITVAYEDEYEDLGSLKIQKTVTGDLNWAEVADKITFTVVKEGEEEKNWSFSAEEFDEVNGNVGSYTISDLEPGKYTVTETVTTKEGYTYSTTYTVTVNTEGEPQESEPQNSSEAKVEVTAGEKSIVHFTNNYTRIPEVGSLTLTKTIEGGPVWDVIKDDLFFVISVKKADGQYEEYKRISGSDLTPSEGKYSITLDDLPAGEYKVQEIISSSVISGGKDYVLTEVTYQVGGGQTTNCTTDKSTSDITIEKNANTSVTFNNTYAANEGSLTLQKDVKGILNGEQEVSGKDAWDAVKDSLTFIVWKYDDTERKYTKYETIIVKDEPADRWKVDSQGYAVLKLEGLPVGKYKVEEISGDLDNYTVRNTAYVVVSSDVESVNAETKSTETGDLDVKRGQNVTVTFTNTYTLNKAELVIEKTIAGLPGADDPEQWEKVWAMVSDKISFVITGNGIEAITIEGKDLVWDAQSSSYKTTVSLPPGEYMVTETVSDLSDYTWKSASYTVTVIDKDDAAKQGSAQSGSTENRESITISDITLATDDTATVSLNNTYERNKGTLVLTKEIVGLSKEQIEKSLLSGEELTFTVENIDTHEMFYYKLSKFEFGEEEEAPYTYTITLDGENMLPTGTYRITESNFDVSNYEAEVTFNVTQTEPKELQGRSGDYDPEDLPAFSVVKDGKTEVTFTNTYTLIPGTLTLKKTVSNDLEWKDVWESLSFEVRDSSGNEVYGSPFSFTAEDLNKQEHIITLELAPGEYTVKEIVTDKTGYTRTTTYTVNGRSAEPDSEGKVEVAVTSNATSEVDVKNDYTQDKGKLVITKILAGLDEDAVAKAEAVSTIKFIVKNAAGGSIGEYLLSEFDEHAGLYTKEIPDLPVGNYTVEETAYTVDGYIIESITYEVNGNGETTLVSNGGDPGAAPTVVIEKVETSEEEGTTISYVNTYTKKLPDTGKLTLQKTVNGDLTWDEVKGTYSFRITYNGDGINTEYTFPLEIAGNDSRWTESSDNVYIFTLENLQPGEYTVTETFHDELDDYSRITLYAVGAGSTVGSEYADGNEIKAEVSSNGENTVTFINTYSLDRGNLTITKIVEGPVSKDDVKNITFTVTGTGADGLPYNKTFTLEDPEVNYDDDSKTYSLTIENLPVGEYTVTETNYDIGGFVTEEVSYKINNQNETKLVENDKEVSKETAKAAVVKGQTTTVTYKDVYKAIPKGSLDIEKIVNGLNWEKLPEYISFTVTGPNGYERTITADDFNKNGNSYTYTIDDLEMGEYTVTENITQEEKGYTRTTSYVVGTGNSTTEGEEATVELTEDSLNGKVTFNNNYTQNYGSLQLNKIVYGLPADELEAAIRGGKIQFTVKNIKTEKEYNCALISFTNNGNGSYTLMYNGEQGQRSKLPEGDYIIVEFNCDIPNYQASVQYAVNGEQPTTGKGSFTIDKDTMTEVTITNTYTSTKGSLVIEKQVTRDPNSPTIGWEDVKKYLTFEIREVGGDYKATISGEQFTDEDGDGIYAYTITGLDVGKSYIVTETSSAVPDYSCEVKYIVSGSAERLNETEAKATISATEGATVKFINYYTYAKETPPSEDDTVTSEPSQPQQAPAPSQSQAPAQTSTPNPSPSPIKQLEVSPTPTPSPSQLPEDGSVLAAERDRVPQTSDYFFMWLSMFLVSMSSLMGYLVYLDKKNRKE